LWIIEFAPARKGLRKRPPVSFVFLPLDHLLMEPRRVSFTSSQVFSLQSSFRISRSLYLLRPGRFLQRAGAEFLEHPRVAEFAFGNILSSRRGDTGFDNYPSSPRSNEIALPPLLLLAKIWTDVPDIEIVSSDRLET